MLLGHDSWVPLDHNNTRWIYKQCVLMLQWCSSFKCAGGRASAMQCVAIVIYRTPIDIMVVTLCSVQSTWKWKW
jgi:hypothetical protein